MEDDKKGYVKFEITDYDLDNEFNPNRGGNLTKEQQIYGVWADEEEDEERHKARKEVKGINFVSSKSTSDQVEIEKDDNTGRPSFSSTSWKKPSENYNVHADNNQMAGFRDSRSKQRTQDGNFCDFEKNTRGIGSKLLLNMGFVPGKGLGKDLQGISKPIELKPRQGKGAISYYGKESANGEKQASQQETKLKKSNDKKDTGRYFDKIPKKKINYVFVDEDLVPKTDTSAFNKLKIIDMTGPDEKVFEGYQEIHKSFKPTESLNRKFEFEDDDSNEVQEVKKMKSQLDYERDRLEELCEEREKCKKEIEFYEQRKRSYALIIEKIVALNSSINDLEQVIEVCEQLDDNELKIEVFYSFGFSAVKHDLRNWLPFDEPARHLDDFKRIYKLFDKKKQFYDQIVWHCWVPYIRMNIEAYNDMRKCTKMITFFDEWHDYISNWIIDILINQHVVLKLEQQIVDWNPIKDEIPIHLWIHPWLTKIRSQELETICRPIRRKLTNALKLWHPSDRSAKIILQPWKHAFGVKNWNAFLKESIIPKLERLMDEFKINPKQQDLKPWIYLFDWKDMIAENELIQILKKSFFPKWLKVLYNWLDNGPNYKEVLDWYLGWKSQFPIEWFNKELVVCQGFTVCLRMIEHSVDKEGKMASFDFIN